MVRVKEVQVRFDRFRSQLPSAEEALPGREAPAFSVPERHEVSGNRLRGPYPAGLEVVDFGLGCFWGAERRFWQVPGVWTTLVGYQGGTTPNPTYEEVCSGLTGHTEVVRVVYDPRQVPYQQLLKAFWESHDPTQGFRQGNDVGTQYRSAVYTHDEAQLAAAQASRKVYQRVLDEAGYGPITTELLPAGPFWPAEPYHQQYLSAGKNPDGYCGLAGTGVKLSDPSAGAGSCQIGVVTTDD